MDAIQEMQADISRLQAEVDRLNSGIGFSVALQLEAIRQRDTAWNDAIEAAADILSSNVSKITEPYGKVLLETYAAAIRTLERT